MPTIYLDNNATTRLAPAASEAMRRYFGDDFGNAASVHAMGQTARHAVEAAREAVASLIGAQPDQVAFTGSGTDSDRLAIAGVLAASPDKKRIVTTAVEHAAIREYCGQLASHGFDVVQVGVDSLGNLDLNALEDSLTTQTALVSVMLANNETGVVFPTRDIAELTRDRGIPFHVDAIQGPGRIAMDVESLGADLVSLSAHKIHGPKGVGGLWIRSGTRFRCPFSGGRHARALRQGTENVPAIVGFGASARLVAASLQAMDNVTERRNRLEDGILSNNDGASIAGDRERRIGNTTTICFEGLEAEAILIGLSERGVYASSGSACSSGSIEPSHVLQAMGLRPEQTRGAIRFSLSRETTDDEIDRAMECVNEVVGRLKQFAA